MLKPPETRAFVTLFTSQTDATGFFWRSYVDTTCQHIGLIADHASAIHGSMV